MSSTYDWTPVLEGILAPFTNNIERNEKINPYDEIRNMDTFQLKAYAFRDKTNKAALDRVVKNVRVCSKEDRLIASKVAYAKNLLAVKGELRRR
jgi:hypothetical protein